MSSADSPRQLSWLAAGLFFVTLATLMLEVLDTRLLSVLTWYHLSFLAVSVAMLGMAAGASSCSSAKDLFAPERAIRMLPAGAAAFALALAVSHLANLAMPFPSVRPGIPMELAALGIATLILTIPFIISGVVVTIALTRTGHKIGWLYGADLIGAAAGCLAIIALLDSPTSRPRPSRRRLWRRSGRSASRATPAHAAVRWRRSPSLLLAAMGLNASSDRRLGVMYPKSRTSVGRASDRSSTPEWNAHSHVIVRTPTPSPPFYWGAAENAPETPVTTALAAIDGDAGTVITQWDGNPESLTWTRFDVTTMPYRLRNGDAAVIGVGGGRDVLSAIHAGNRSVTGIEINSGLVGALTGRYRDFAARRDASGRHAGARRGALVPDARAGTLRRAADVADRHLGGDRRRRLHADRERALHARGLGRLPARAEAERRLQRVALVRPGTDLRDDAAAVAGRGVAARRRDAAIRGGT